MCNFTRRRPDTRYDFFFQPCLELLLRLCRHFQWNHRRPLLAAPVVTKAPCGRTQPYTQSQVCSSHTCDRIRGTSTSSYGSDACVQLPAAGTSGHRFSRVSCDLRYAGSCGRIHSSSAYRNLPRVGEASERGRREHSSRCLWASSLWQMPFMSSPVKLRTITRLLHIQPKRHGGACCGTWTQEVQQSGGCARTATRELAELAVQKFGFSVEDARQLCENTVAEADACLAAWQYTAHDHLLA